MSETKTVLDEVSRRDYEPEPRYGDEVETWPSEQEMTDDADNEQ